MDLGHAAEAEELTELVAVEQVVWGCHLTVLVSRAVCAGAPAMSPRYRSRCGLRYADAVIQRCCAAAARHGGSCTSRNRQLQQVGSSTRHSAASASCLGRW